MKEFDCIVSGQLDNPSSNVESYLSDDNDKPDLQQTPLSLPQFLPHLPCPNSNHKVT